METSDEQGASGAMKPGIYALRACGFGGPIDMVCPVHGETLILSEALIGVGG